MSKLLTDLEVAERLRCSGEKVRRLRYRGLLPYVPGRPVLTAEADLDAYLDSAKRRAVPAGPSSPGPAPDAADTDASAEAAARARQAWLLRKVGGR